MKPHWTPDNSFELLENGEAFYPRVFDAIRQAKREVLLETFILFDDPIGRELREALLVAARRGVAVKVLVDGWGSADLGEAFLQPLLDAGVQWRVFEPTVRWWGWRVNPFRRMHRKLAVIDGDMAFVGGINYSHDHVAAFGPEAKQDYAVALHGPVVAQVHDFCSFQQREKNEAGRPSWWSRWRRHRRAGRARAGEDGWAAFVVRDNGLHRRDIERQYRLALRAARSHVMIANAYFFPGYRLLREIRRAARRGVRVELILQGRPDMPIVQTAASMLYAWLVKSGVHVFEYCERPLHGKVAVVDELWATVGSSNLDPTSLGLNLEANVLIRDRAFARELQQRLRRLVEHHCQQVDPEAAHGQLPWWARWQGALLHHVLRWWPRWMHALPEQVAEVRAQRRSS